MRRRKLTTHERHERRRRGRAKARRKWDALDARAALFRNNVARFGRAGTSVAEFDRLAREHPVHAAKITKKLTRLRAVEIIQ
jgi:hypothetical protein